MFFPSAIAQTAQAGAAQSNVLTQMLPLLLMFAVLYFLMIRPQQKRQKELKKMLADLKVGDEVVAAGGIYARVISVSDEKVVVNLSFNSSDINHVVVQKAAIHAVLPQGSLDALKS